MFTEISYISVLDFKYGAFVLSLAICKDNKLLLRYKLDFDDLNILLTVELFFKSVERRNFTC